MRRVKSATALRCRPHAYAPQGTRVPRRRPVTYGTTHAPQRPARWARRAAYLERMGTCVCEVPPSICTIAPLRHLRADAYKPVPTTVRHQTTCRPSHPTTHRNRRLRSLRTGGASGCTTMPGYKGKVNPSSDAPYYVSTLAVVSCPTGFDFKLAAEKCYVSWDSRTRYPHTQQPTSRSQLASAIEPRGV